MENCEGKELKSDSLLSAGPVIIVFGVLFMAIGALIGMPSFFGASSPNPMVNYLFLLGAIALVVGMILTAHGVAVNDYR